MVVGQNGVTGRPAPYLVEVETKVVHVRVTIPHQSMEGKIVRLMDQQIQKPKNVKKIHAQVNQYLDEINQMALYIIEPVHHYNFWSSRVARYFLKF